MAAMGRMAPASLVALAGLVGVVATIVGSAAAETGRLVTFPAPPGRQLSADFAVEARPVGGNWQQLDAYSVTVDRDTYSTAAMVGFDADGPVEISVRKTSGTIRSARVRPLSYGITPAIGTDGKTATFVVPRPLDVSFEVNGDILRNVHVFANPLEQGVPRPGPRVISFGPGVHTLGGDHILRVPSNTTVYLAGGAVVEGSLTIANARNVVVRGRGIIDPSRFFLPPAGRATILVNNSTDVGIRDITLLRAQDGGITIADSARVVVANVREITVDHSSDGIDIDASTDVLIDDVFLRTSNDSIAVYATTPWYGHGGTRDVTVRNSTLWADVAHPFLTGVHGDPRGSDVIEQLAVQNVDILEHDEYRGGDLFQGALAINAGDRVTVRDVRFDNVRIEDFSRGQVVNLKVFRNPAYNKRAGLEIERVLFRNVRYEGKGDSPSRVTGYTPSRRVAHVTFESLTRNGETVLQPAAGNIVVGRHTSSIVFRRPPPQRSVGGASGALRYSGRWLRRADPGSHGGDIHAPLQRGSRLVYAFKGRQARIYGLTGPDGGKVEVLVDGKSATTVDTYSYVPRTHQIWFDTGVLDRGSHTLELRYESEKNVLATAAAIGFDNLEIVP